MVKLVEVSLDSAYLINEEGHVYSTFTNRFLKPSFSKGTGYLVVNIRVNGKRQPVYIHRLVAAAFLPINYIQTDVNHRDGNKCNNNVTNLEWCTDAENKEHAKKMGLILSGDKLPQSKLTEEEVHEVCKMFQEGCTTGQIIRSGKFNTTRYQLLNIRSRRDWVYVSEGYDWIDYPEKRNKLAK